MEVLKVWNVRVASAIEEVISYEGYEVVVVGMGDWEETFLFKDGVQVASSKGTVVVLQPLADEYK